jgi:hypothetical protein
MHNLEHFTQLYGVHDFLRIIEIKAPKSEEVYIRRMYEELGLIIKMIEAGRKERSDDDEDRLSVEIVNCLNSAGYFCQKDPTHGGHVDFLVIPERNKNFKWYGEAKIWDGVTYLSKGISQLISRYASGREKNLGFLIYFKSDSLVSKMTGWLDHLKAGGQIDSSKTKEIDEFSFTTSHPHSSGTNIEIRHLAVNIHWNPS